MHRLLRVASLSFALLVAACVDGPTDPAPAASPSVVAGVWQFEVPTLTGGGLTCDAIGDAYRLSVRGRTIDAVEVPSDRFELTCSADDGVRDIHMPGLFVAAPHGEADGAAVVLEWRYVTPTGSTELMRADAHVSGNLLEGVLTYRDARDGERFFTGRIVGRRITP